MRRSLTLALTLAAAVAAPALANEAVDRFEAASETMGSKINAALLAENPALEGKLPDVTWDDAHRQAGACILSTVAQEAGTGAMTQLITGLEAAAAKSYRSLAEISAAQTTSVDGITPNRLQEITDSCGMTALSMQRMQAAMGN